VQLLLTTIQRNVHKHQEESFYRIKSLKPKREREEKVGEGVAIGTTFNGRGEQI
jgi:hypothetical protein